MTFKFTENLRTRAKTSQKMNERLDTWSQSNSVYMRDCWKFEKSGLKSSVHFLVLRAQLRLSYYCKFISFEPKLFHYLKWCTQKTLNLVHIFRSLEKKWANCVTDFYLSPANCVRLVFFLFFSMNRRLTMLVQRFFSKKYPRFENPTSQWTMSYFWHVDSFIFLYETFVTTRINSPLGFTIDAYYVLSHVPFLASFHLMRRHNFNMFLFLQGLIAALTESAWFSSSQVAVHYFIWLRISMKNQNVCLQLRTKIKRPIFWKVSWTWNNIN